jgi:L-2-hydroxycarboxylate dehydrogenase (NAD+)
VRRDAGAAKRDGLKIHWLSAYAGSNPAPCITHLTRLSDMKIKIEDIKRMCIDVATKHGLSKEDAEVLVSEYLEGELRSRKCHGFSAFPKFAIKALSSRRGDFKIVKDSETHMLVDGMGNLGQIVCNKLIPEMIEKTKKNGIATLGIRNMESYLMPGTYARQIAEKDLVCFIFNYGGRERIAPTASIDPIFGTNPIAIGIPTKERPIVLDMATSAYAMGKVRLALKLNQKLPEGVAIDKDGKPTTDPQEAMDGALLSFGGHKASGLALVVEILSRCLLDVHRKNDEVYRGYFFMMFDPSSFIELDKFKENVEELKQQIKSSRKADGFEDILLPGEMSDKIKEENLKKHSLYTC